LVPRLIRDPATWLIYAQLGIWGYFLYGFSPVVLLLRDEQHTSRSVASLHSMALAAAALIGGALFPWLSRRIGRGAAMWLGLTGVAAGVVALCLVRPVPATIGSVVVLATFGTFTLSGVVAALGEKHGPAGPAAIAEANAIACGLGAVAPLVVGASVAAGWTWRPAIAVVVALIGAVALGAKAFRVRVPRGEAVPVITAPEPLVVAAPQPSRTGRLPSAYWLAWAVMALTGSVEVCLNLWAGDVLRSHAGMSAGAAATAVSGIVGGMCLGRVIGGRIALRVPPYRLLLCVLAVSAAGFALFWAATLPWLAITGLIICGAGNGMHYPLGIGMALQVSGGRSDLAAARSSYAMSIGFGVAPLALGAVADHIGARPAFLLLPVFLAMSALLVAPLGRRLAPTPPFDPQCAGT
jgi:fucose permease